MEPNPIMLDVLARPVAMDPRFLASAVQAAGPAPKPKGGVDDLGMQDGIATIRAWGPVGKGWGFDPCDLAAAVEGAAAKAQAVVLQFDSPGGTVGDVADCAARIAVVEKPLVVHTSGLLCSAAFWLAAGADAIIGGTSAEVGSIGVYCPMLDVTGLYKMFGISVELAKTGELKGMGFPGIPWTDAQKAHMQQMVDDIFGDFKAAVLANRPGVPEDAMTGGAYMSKRAEGLGLVDAVGTSADALQLARELAKAKQILNK